MLVIIFIIFSGEDGLSVYAIKIYNDTAVHKVANYHILSDLCSIVEVLLSDSIFLFHLSIYRQCGKSCNSPVGALIGPL